MRVPVLVETLAGNSYRARAGDPFALTAEGDTPYAAVQKLRELIKQKLQAGAVMFHIDVPIHESPFAEYAGMFKDDPMFQEVLEIMAENRRKADEDPNYL